MRLVVTTLCLLSLTACFDFEDPRDVKDLRVLAARIDPPEVMVEAVPGGRALYTVTADPPPVAVNLLVVDPDNPYETLHYSVEACLPTDSERCADAPAEQRMPVPVAGTASPEVLTFAFAPDAARLNEWLAEDDYRGFDGLFVMLDVTITRGDDVLHAAKLVTYNVPIVPRGEGQDPPPPKVANANPVLDGLRFDATDSEGPDTTITLKRDHEYDLTPVFDRDTQVERYPVATFPGDGKPPGYRVLEERLNFELYTTAGHLGDAQLTTRTPVGEVEDPKTTYRSPAEAPDEPVVMWVVVRDDRGGCSWTRRTIVLQ